MQSTVVYTNSVNQWGMQANRRRFLFLAMYSSSPQVVEVKKDPGSTPGPLQCYGCNAM